MLCEKWKSEIQSKKFGSPGLLSEEQMYCLAEAGGTG